MQVVIVCRIYATLHVVSVESGCNVTPDEVQEVPRQPPGK